jgi:hypothetical protein
MPLAQIAPLFPSIVALLGGLGIGSALWLRAVHRKRGRRLIERRLASRGETLVAIKTLPFTSLPIGTGLSSTLIFRILARKPDGEEQTYEWAYEPRVFPWQTDGLKRCAHGIWIALA